MFAVATIEAWWADIGKEKYPNARRILITADGGGSNGHRPWPWKLELARLSAAIGVQISPDHRMSLPAGYQQMEQIEHRLFSRITLNWRGRPLECYLTVVNLIANTTTKTGLTVRCQLDLSQYPTKIKVTDKEKEAIPIFRHEFHGDWNYDIGPPTE